jgi:hypothetical protein
MGAMQIPEVVEIQVLEAAGDIGSPRRLNLVLWFHAVRGPKAWTGAGITALLRPLRGGSWDARELPVSDEGVAKVVARLETLGVPGRAPRVSGVIDTSDTWSSLSVQVRRDERPSSIFVDMLASGFTGEDAEPLRALLRCLYDLAGGNVPSMCL